MNLLKSKLHIPRLGRKVIPRPHLRNKLEHMVIRYNLVTTSAPAGYGKTTLLAEWARNSNLPVCWLSLEREENDVERFLRYLFAAWETVRPKIDEASVGILLGSQTPEIKLVLSAFLDESFQVPDHLVFVLDDYHLIENPDVHEALIFLLDHAPPSLHFVLAGRGEPPLSLARYRARDQLLELHADDLRFLPEETQIFLNDQMGLNLSSEEIQSLQTKLEGWIAGLQLAALTMRQDPKRIENLALSGRHRFIVDYLREDVLDQLPLNVRKFLLQTGILDRMCASLCEAVTGKPDSQGMLETLEREALFLMALDENREWFRYHQLFADFLLEELKRRSPDSVPDLHRRAARWYLSRNQPELAFRHAADGADVELVSQIFERYLAVKLLGGEVRVVKGWLDSLPESWQTTYPAFVLARAGVLLATGQFEACARHLDEVERLALAGAEDVELHRARVTAMRCNIACFQNDLAQAEALAQQALRILSENDLDFLAGIYGALGDTYRRNGRWDEAKASYLKLLDYTQAPTFRVQAVHIYGALADLALRQGHLRDAATYWKKALDAIRQRENRGNFPLPLTGWVYIRMGELYYEWSELRKAREHLSKGMERAELGGDVRSLIAGYLLSARLKLTEGNIEQATAYLERARPHVEGTQFAYWNSRFERLQLELWLAQGKLRTAVNWVDSKLEDLSPGKQLETDFDPLAVTRVLVVKGDKQSLEHALALLEQLLHAAEAEGRMGIQIETLAFQAILHWKREEEALAMTTLERALRLAKPEGYVRLFSDLGLSLGRLLQEARSRHVMPEYVEQLLEAFGEGLSSSAPTQKALTEPLTQREADVLELMAAGLTNLEIAQELIVSPGTIKKHTGHIYRKLGVHSRTEAAARARELNLLG